MDTRRRSGSRRSRGGLVPRRSRRIVFELLEQRVLLSSLPDLIVSGANAPGSAIVGNGQTIPISWTVTNQGGGVTMSSPSWDDIVYVSPTQTFNPSTAIQIDDEPHDNILGLDGGSSYTVTDSVTVPSVPASFSLGSDYVLFVANADNTLTESTTSNNTTAVPITLSAPDVDLAISDPSSSSTEAIAGNGNSLTYSWTVSNLGSDTAGADRNDVVYLANATTLGAATESWQMASVDSSTLPDLAGGASITETATGSIPNVPAGSYDLVFVVNDTGDSDYGPQQETNSANDTTFLPITVTRPSVDLELATASLSSSSTITEGSDVTVNYTVENVGSDPAAGSWNDAIYLSGTPTVGSNSQLLDSFSPPGTAAPLNAQASYANQDTVTIPQAATGSAYLVVVTNDGDLQAETDDPTDANDSFAIPVTLNAPDLAATIVSSPSTATEGATVPITYTVTNQGSVATVTDWYDSVYLSPTATFDPNTATLVQSFPTENEDTGTDLAPLAAGASYTNTVNVTIPGFATGAQYLVVVADDDNVSDQGYGSYQPDSNPANNAASAAITLSAPDLTITAATAPSTAIEGQSINLSWSVENIGSAPAPGDWTDAVFLSSSSELDDTATFLESFDEGSQAPLAPDATYSDDQSITIPPTATGTEYLIFVTNIGGLTSDPYYTNYSETSQGETNYANNTDSVPITLSAPDLTITTAAAPSSAIVGTSINVSWTVQNIGSVTAPGDWFDAVFIGNSPTFDADSDILLASYSESNQSPLDAGASYTDDESIALPNDAALGDEYLIFVTNDYAVEGDPYEPAQGETNYSNNTYAVPLTVEAPDLTITTATAPSSATLGGPINVTWQVENIGTVAAPGDWYDAVYVSSSSTLDKTATYVASFYEGANSPLAPDASYADNESISLPADAPTGNEYLIFVTNYEAVEGYDYDYDAQGETDYTNNTFSVPISVSAPDLTVVTATAPSSAILSGPFDVSWQVQNIGAVAAPGDWYDAVYIGSSPTFDSSSDFYVASFYEGDQSPLVAGASYTDDESIALPADAPTGAEYLIFVTNYEAVDGDYYDYDAQGETDYTNNTFSVPISVSAPDLTVTTATAPSSAIEGGSIEVSWTVQNIGAVEAPGDWYDAVFIGDSPTFNASSDTYVASFDESANSPLAAGSSYTVTNQSITIPSTTTGSEYLIFVANYYAVEGDDDNYYPAQGETNYLNNTYAVPITLSAPDLTVTAINAPASGSAITVDSTIPISWTVENIGTVAAAGTWTDEVYLSSTPTLGESYTYVTSFYADAYSPLAAGSSYTVSLNVQIPNDSPIGSDYLIVETNAYGNQPETDTSNNTLAIPVTVAAPDLVVSSASINPTSAEVGNDQSVSLNYQVTNQGTVPALGYWYDGVYLSSTPTFDPNTATFLTDFYEDFSSGLTPNASYSEEQDITIPNTATGSEYVLVVTNYYGVEGGYYDYDYQSETNYTNNIDAIPITLTQPSVDLAISQPSAPATADVDESIAIAFTVTNIGTETAQADWTDSVYLGTSPTYTSGDPLVSSYDADEYGDSPLDAGTSYATNDTVQVSNVAPGSYYLIFITNDGDSQAETDYTNDSTSLPITITAPDLTVTSATIANDPDGVLIQNNTYTVDWTVQNAGTVDALAGWYDEIILSSTPTFNEEDYTSLGEFYEGYNSPLAAGASYQDNESVTIPSDTSTGSEYLLVVTNFFAVEGSLYSYDAQSETSYTNNTDALPVVVSKPAADLTITTATAPSSAILGQQVQVSWTVANQGTDPANGDWYDAVYLSNDPSLGDNSQLIAEFNESAYSGLSDQSGDNTYTDNETITIPATATGARYLVFDTNATGSQSETDPNNNTYAVPITLSSPDLVATTASAPATATAGQTISVSWTVENEGSVATVAGSWTDYVYISNDQTLSPDDTLLEGVTINSSDATLPLVPGASYTITSNVTLSSGISGDRYLLFVPDGDGSQPEYGESNTIDAQPIAISVPDPAVTGVNAPGTAAPGQTIPISWTVTNEGDATTVDDWEDEVYLYNQTNNSYSGWGDDYVPIGSPYVPLAPGASYTISENFTIPVISSAGEYTLYVVTDANGAQPELTTTNDTYTQPLTIALPDPAVTTVTAPASVTPGQTIPISWVVQNDGTVPAFDNWTDKVYLSPDQTLDSNATLLASVPITSPNVPLAPGASYTIDQNIAISASAPGNEYLLVVTDADGGQPEVTTSNDLFVQPITINPEPDLAPQSIAISSNPTFGQPVTISWVDQNIGQGSALEGWTDNVYYSASSTLDSSAILLGTVSAAGDVPLAAGAGASLSTTVTLPFNASTAAGTYDIFVQTNSTGSLIETSTSNDVGSLQTSIAVSAPDLVVSNIVNPETGETDQPVDIDWTDSNQGNIDVTNGWDDQVYASPDGLLDNAVLLGDFPEEGTLAAGGSVNIVQSVTLPGTAGTYSIIVVTNANNSVNEGPNAANDTTVSTTTINVLQEPLADLVVTSIVPPPDGVFSGQSVPITYTVENEGTGATSVPVWHDFVILSQNPSLTFNGTYDQLLNNQPVLEYFDNPSYLGVGQSYQNTVDVTLPITAQGPWYVYVVANGLGTHYHYTLPESNRANNLLVSAPFNVQLTPAPALDVATVVAPSQAFSGQPLTVNWTVSNVGAGPTVATSWTDEVFMSPTSTYDSSTAIPLGVFTHNGALAAGGSYSQSQTVTLPVAVSGTYYFIVQTDVKGQVFQDGDTAQNIGVEASATTVNLTPPPDLTVKAVVPGATSVLAGHTLNVTYTILNAGAGVTEMAAGSDVPVAWTDAFYLSPTTTLNPSTEIAIGTTTHTGALAAGNRYTDNVTLTLPDAISGTYYLIADADVGDLVYEIDLTSKVGASTNTIAVTSEPADLVVSSFNAPTQIQAGTNVTVSWTVKNQGTGDTIATSWNDEVFASASADLASPILLDTFGHKGLLNAGQSYSTSQAVAIPLTLSGTYYLFVTTNPEYTDPTTKQLTYAVYESNYANDNSSEVTATVTQSLSDLEVTKVNAPSSLETGETVTITWTTDNDGTATTNASSWYDDVWMSTDTDVNEGGDDVYLGSAYRSNALAAGQSYTGTATVTIPYTVAAGTYYIIVRADRPSQIPGDTNSSTVNRVLESNELNNDTASAAIPVTAGPVPDLTVTSVTAPSTAVEGQPISVSWTVANQGASTNQSWNDAVYLSLDTLFDPRSAIYLGYVTNTGGLASGQSDNQQASFNIPAGLSGNYNVLVVTNAGDSLYESNYTNDVGASSQQVDISLTAPVDLVAGTITIPANAIPGSNITFSYMVTNQSSNDAVGQWTDSLYLSTTNSFVYTDPLLATNVHTGGLPAGQSYTDQINAPVPGVAPGTYYVILRTDVLNQIPDTNEANNVSASLSGVSIDAPALTLGTAQDGTLGQDQSAYYKVIVASGQTLQVTFDSQTTASLNELFVSYGTLPSQSQANYRYTSLAADQQITVPVTQAGTYYILAYGSSVVTTAENYSITAALVPFAVQSIEPAQVGQGLATIEIDGSKFDNNTTFELLGPNDTVVNEGQVQLHSSTTAFVQFNLTGMPTGQYTVVAIASDGTAASVSNALTVVPASSSGLQIYLSVPSGTLPNSQGDVTVNYVNQGNTDVLAPLLELVATNALVKLPDQTSFTSSSVQFLGISATGPAGVIRPGESGSVSIQYDTTGAVGQDIDFQLQIADDSQPMDWTDAEAGLQLPSIPDAAWPAVFANFVAYVGSTVASYHAALAADASYLGQFGEATDDVDQLLSFEIEKANAGYTAQTLDSVTPDSLPAPGMDLTFTQSFEASIAGRYTEGILGYGWTTNWDISASTESNGDAVIEDDGARLVYSLQSDGNYQGMTGDYNVVTFANGAYILVQPDGTTYQFNPNGTLAYVEDSDGSRISAGYNTAGQLATLTDSNGEWFALTYNSDGHLSELTDSNGLTETYGYDATGNFLTSYTDRYGTTNYTYVTDGTAAQDNALAEIAWSDNTHMYFTYDSEGRLIDQHRDGDAEDETFTYLNPGGYTETDGDGNSTTYFFDRFGATVETIDPLGNATYYQYDSNLNLVQVDGPQGTEYTYTYDADGNLTSETDPLGNTVDYTYDSNNNVTSYTDANGNTTSYAYDSSNDLLSVTYANGTEQQYSYNPLGEATQFVDANGDAIGYVYNSQGLVTQESFADGSTYTFSYDDRGDMLTATDSSGTITFMYGDSSNPDLLTEVTYPDGTYLEFTYTIVGQRTQSVDQTGFIVDYVYDSVGRLSELTDGSGNLIVRYTYDAAGNLVQKDMGDGTRTVYTYDGDGDVLSITNYAPDHVTVNSYDDYTYDAMGNVVTDTSQDGEWTYTYDADGELTGAVFVSSNTSVLPDQNLQYVYDAAGNRISETVNGVTTTYLSNDVNEYTSSTTNGVTTTYQYDANGNLIAETVGGSTTTFTLNELNELTAVNGPSLTASYGYNPLGSMISQTVNGTTTNYLIDPTGLGNVVASYDGSGIQATHYTYGVGLASQVNSSGVASYYDFNLQGSTIGITNTEGSYLNQYVYQPFGQVTTISAGIANPFTFAGQFGVLNDGSGLLSMRARNYDTSIGQFVSNDPLGVYAGDSNIRRYVENDPTNLVDPSGMQGAGGGGSCPNPFKRTPTNQLPPARFGGWKGTPPQQQPPPQSQGPPPGAILVYPPSEPGGYGNPGPYAGYWNGIPYVYSNSAPTQALTNDGGEGGGDPPNDPAGAGGGGGGGCNCNGMPPDPPVPPGGPGPHGNTPIGPPHDPNDIIGPAGYGDGNYISVNQVLPYEIEFENDPTAALPAQQVTITQQLDPNFNWQAFRLGSFGFGGMTFTVPADSSFYQTTIDLSQTLGYDVQVAATIDELTGVATWTFTTIDPATGEIPTDPTIGFLPPDDPMGTGEGFVSYTIMANLSDPDGTVINAQATVVFDTQPPINTQQIFNTIGSEPPTVTLSGTAPDFTSNSFTLSWNGQDDANGPGITDYNIFVSTNGGAYTSFLQGTTQTQATFTGQADDTYSFYAVAVDNTGTSSVPSATVTVLLVPPPSQPAPPALFPADDSGTQSDGITDDASPSLTGTTQADATVELLNSTNTVIATTTADSSGNYVVAVPGAPLSPGTYEFTVVASNANGSSPASTPFSLVIVAAPATPAAPGLLASDDSGIQGDGITDVTSPSLTGTTIANATAQLLNAGNQVIGTTSSAADGSYTFAIAGPLSVGLYQYSVEVIDQYGDMSSPSAAFSLQIVSAPPTPSAPALLSSDDSGTQGDGITDVANPSLTGNTIANATVQLLNASNQVIGTATSDTEGAYTIAIPGPLSVGTYQYRVGVTDQYGDVSSPSGAFSLQIVAAPATPNAPALLSSDDSGILGDGITDVTSPHLTGTTLANATVQLLNASNQVIGETTSGTGGAYTIAIPGPLSVGTYQYRVEVTNQYGDVSSPSAAFTLGIVAAPATPGAPMLPPSEDIGNQTTYLGSPSLIGTTLANATVQLLNGSGTVLSTAQADGSGNYEVQVPGPLSVGSYQFRVQVIDPSGNTSSPSAPQTITVASPPPINPNNPPPGPVVEGTTAVIKKGSIQSIVIVFSAAMDSSSVDNLNNYTLIDAGSDHIFGNKNDSTVRLSGVSYNAAADSATLTLKKPVSKSHSLRLTLDAQPGGLDGASGQLLNATEGRPGSNYVAFLGKPAKVAKPPKPKKPKAIAAVSRPVLAEGHVATKVPNPARRAVAPNGVVAADQVASPLSPSAIDALLELVALDDELPWRSKATHNVRLTHRT